MSQLDPSTIVGALILAASNLGAAKLLLTRSLDRQDKMDEKLQKHSELMASATATQEATVQALAQVQESVKELFESRNELKDHAVEVDALHKFKGCNQPNGGKQQ